MGPQKHLVSTKHYRIKMKSSFKKLEILKLENDFKGFYKAFLSVVPELRIYVDNFIKQLEAQGHLLPNFYEADDFIDELFLVFYYKFDQIKSDDDFYIFLFVHLNNLLRKAQETEDMEHQSIESISEYEESERYQMIERMRSQLDGDLILEEELDDISYHKNELDYKPIFEVETAQRIEKDLDDSLRHDWSSKQVDALIDHLPQPQRNIATLYIHFHLTVPEIVHVARKSSDQVKEVIHNLKEALKVELFNA